MKRLFATLLFLLSFNVAQAQAQDRPTQIRTIEVMGEGEVNVVPDEATINLGVETSDMSLERAKAESDKRVQQIIKTLRDAGIAERDIQTQRINIEPQYDYRPEGRQFLGFMIRRNIVANIRDIAKLDDVTSRLITAGITSIFNYEYKTSQDKKFKQEARVKAVAAAKEKAEALAKELGLRVVKAYTVIEDDQQNPGIPMYRQANSSGQDGSVFALGEIVVRTGVRVIFEVQ